MYDFLLQEEWWMDTIIAACITAVVTLLGSFIAYQVKIAVMQKEIHDLLEKLKDLSGEHKGLSGEHKDLSGEHKGLSGEHKDLSKEHRNLKDEIHKVIVYQESEKTAREMAGRTLTGETELVNMAKAVLENHRVLQQDNAKLKEQNNRLIKQLNNLKRQNIHLTRQNTAAQEDYSIGLEGMDLFDGLDGEEPEL